jgi:hypothetical protein
VWVYLDCSAVVYLAVLRKGSRPLDKELARHIIQANIDRFKELLETEPDQMKGDGKRLLAKKKEAGKIRQV